MRAAELQILPPLTRAREMPRVTPTERTQQCRERVSTFVVGAQWGVLSSQRKSPCEEFKVSYLRISFMLGEMPILETCMNN